MLGKKSGASALFSFYCAALQSCPALALRGKSPSLAVVSPYGAPMPHKGIVSSLLERRGGIEPPHVHNVAYSHCFRFCFCTPHMSPLGHIVERCAGSCWCRVVGATSRPGSWGATSARHITTAHRFPYRLFVPVRPFPGPLARCAQYRRRIEGRKSDDWEIV